MTLQYDDDLDKIEAMRRAGVKDPYKEFCKKYLGAKGAGVLAGEVRSAQENPKFRKHTILIVEGIDDSRFFKRFVDKSKCKVIIACGKNTATKGIQTMETFPRKLTGVIAILDADYDQILGTDKDLPNNIIRTGNHDVEVKIIRSSALDGFLTEYSVQQDTESLLERVKKKHLRDLLFETAFQLGCLRLYNEREKLRNKPLLKMKSVDITCFINPTNLSLNLIQLLKAICNNSPSARKTVTGLMDAIVAIKKEKLNFWQVCRGHDVVDILTVGLKAFGTSYGREMKPEIIGKWLRGNFSQEHFSQTELYDRIQKWQDENKPFIVLPQSNANEKYGSRSLP